MRRIVWCTVASVDSKGRPRVRILHPVWEGQTALIGTGRHSFKEKHLPRNPFVSLSYWDPQHEQVYAECHAQWIDDVAEKQRVGDLLRRRLATTSRCSGRPGSRARTSAFCAARRGASSSPA